MTFKQTKQTRKQLYEPCKVKNNATIKASSLKKQLINKNVGRTHMIKGILLLPTWRPWDSNRLFSII
jgi:hypothetical protein